MATPSIKRDDLVAAIDELLESPGVPDYCPNGLQVEGASEIQHVVCGVTACQELIDEAVERGAQALLVHHGILWGGMPRIVRSFKRRVATLLAHDINLIAYHLPLDRHPTLGNGATVAQRLGLVDLEPFCLHKGVTVGVAGRLPGSLGIDQLADRCADTLDTVPVVIDGGPDMIRRVGIVTGGADKDFPQALDAGLDCYITGEISEYVMHFAKEEGIHFIAAGHHATERFGVQALGEHLANQFGFSWEFVDVPNPA